MAGVVNAATAHFTMLASCLLGVHFLLKIDIRYTYVESQGHKNK